MREPVFRVKTVTRDVTGVSFIFQRNNVNQFIEREADVSADIVHSSDESENSSLDAMDDSFIDDQTQGSMVVTPPFFGVYIAIYTESH